VGKAVTVILVVEDNPSIQGLLCDLLEGEGHRVEVAADGRAAIERIGRGGLDLVLLDLMLPGLDGLEISRHARQRARSEEPYLPIIMLTALSQATDQRAGFAAGADDYVVKPFDNDTLLARIAVWLRMREHSKAALATQQAVEQQVRDAQLEVMRVAARELAHQVNNDLVAAVALLEMMEIAAEMPQNLRVLVPETLDRLAHGSDVIAQLSNVTHIATRETPVGPALDIDRSTQPPTADLLAAVQP
jgi:DNA-binding response OmpR family regulator